jgi:hypothetical protein
MANWIEQVSEPRFLYLAWQPPDHVPERHRWAVGVLERDGEIFVFRYLEPDAIERLNDGRSFEQLLALGYEGYPAFNRKTMLHTENVFSAFMRRLPPRHRSDFVDYKSQFRLAAQVDFSDFMLLGLTEAKLPSDGFSLVDPLDGGAERRDLLIEVAGFRHYVAEIDPPTRIGETVAIFPEPTNKIDRQAVVMQIRGQTIGYVNRLQTAAFQRWLAERDVQVVVERLNGRPDRPRAYVFVRVRPAARPIAA